MGPKVARAGNQGGDNCLRWRFPHDPNASPVSRAVCWCSKPKRALQLGCTNNPTSNLTKVRQGCELARQHGAERFEVQTQLHAHRLRWDGTSCGCSANSNTNKMLPDIVSPKYVDLPKNQHNNHWPCIDVATAYNANLHCITYRPWCWHSAASGTYTLHGALPTQNTGRQKKTNTPETGARGTAEQTNEGVIRRGRIEGA